MSVNVEDILRSHGVGVGNGMQILEGNIEPTNGVKDGVFWYNPDNQEIKIRVDGEFRQLGGGSGSIATVYTSSYETTAYENEVPVGILDFDPDQDILLVHKNSTYIKKGRDYELSADGTVIQKVDGSWADGIVFDFMVIAVTFDPGAQETGLKLLKLNDHQTVNGSSVTNIPFQIPEFIAGVDILEVYQKEVRLFEGIHWTLNADKKSIDLNGYSVDIGETFHFEVFKKIRDNFANPDGSLIMDDSIINAKLAADIKIGSLSDLSTTNKTSVVDALNEIHALIQDHIANS